MTVLAVPIGPPACGKSTFLATRFGRFQIVNLDTLRGWVSDDPADQTATKDAADVQELLVMSRCRRRLPTAVDATNLDPEHRAPLLAIAHTFDMLRVAIVFHTPPETCLRQNRQRAAAGGMFVPEDKIRLMWRLLPPAGQPVAGFDITRHVGDGCCDWGIHGDIPPEHADAPWLR